VQIVCICTDFVLGGLYNNNSGRITSIVAAPGFDCFSLCWFYYLQIKREISTMKLVKHPNIVQIFEVSQCPFQWKLLSWKRGYESSWVD
jgi:serine/threonine protein kinase